jgi:hypothetical protein
VEEIPSTLSSYDATVPDTDKYTSISTMPIYIGETVPIVPANAVAGWIAAIAKSIIIVSVTAIVLFICMSSPYVFSVPKFVLLRFLEFFIPNLFRVSLILTSLRRFFSFHMARSFLLILCSTHKTIFDTNLSRNLCENNNGVPNGKYGRKKVPLTINP